MFTKLLRPVVTHWRSQGIRISVYLNDGIGADSSKALCLQKSQLVRKDPDRLGLLVNGFVLDLIKGEFSIPPSKIDNLFHMISMLLDSVAPTARVVSRLVSPVPSFQWNSHWVQSFVCVLELCTQFKIVLLA